MNQEYLTYMLIEICRNIVQQYEAGNISIKEPKHAMYLTMLANRLEEVDRMIQQEKETRNIDQ
tara:strand:- start:99 stop:287 length:189 start_codon:yes stop_codon:yes gene_type:complete